MPIRKQVNVQITVTIEEELFKQIQYEHKKWKNEFPTVEAYISKSLATQFGGIKIEKKVRRKKADSAVA